MKSKYIKTLLALVAVVAINELVKPWVYVNNRNSVKRPAGYHPVWSKPEVKPPSEMKKIFDIKEDDSEYRYDVKYDSLTLLFQRVSIFCFFLTILLYLNSSRIIFRVLTVLSALCFLFSLYLLITSIRY